MRLLSEITGDFGGPSPNTKRDIALQGAIKNGLHLKLFVAHAPNKQEEKSSAIKSFAAKSPLGVRANISAPQIPSTDSKWSWRAPKQQNSNQTSRHFFRAQKVAKVGHTMEQPFLPLD
jgi:hypothetical protein